MSVQVPSSGEKQAEDDTRIQQQQKGGGEEKPQDEVPAPQPQSESTNASLYVGDLPLSVDEDKLKAKFSTIGQVLSTRVCRDAVTCQSLRYGYVTFQTHEDAKKALMDLNFDELDGQPMRLMWCQRDPALRRSDPRDLIVENLADHVDSKVIYETFSKFGKILSCKVVLDGNGKSKGFGFIYFETEESAKEAIEKVDGKELDGKKISVGEFVPHEKRYNMTAESFTYVFVRGFDKSVDKTQLQELFAKYGPIESVVVKKSLNGPPGKAHGFVDFESHDDAVKAVAEVDGMEWQGSKLSVSRAATRAERDAALRRARAEEPTIDCQLCKVDVKLSRAEIHAFEEHGVICLRCPVYRCFKLFDGLYQRAYSSLSAHLRNDHSGSMTDQERKILEAQQLENRDWGACYNCRQKGHISCNCPELRRRGGGGGGGAACFNCGREGHISRDCTMPRRGGGKGACYTEPRRGGGGSASRFQARPYGGNRPTEDQRMRNVSNRSPTFQQQRRPMTPGSFSSGGGGGPYPRQGFDNRTGGRGGGPPSRFPNRPSFNCPNQRPPQNVYTSQRDQGDGQQNVYTNQGGQGGAPRVGYRDQGGPAGGPQMGYKKGYNAQYPQLGVRSGGGSFQSPMPGRRGGGGVCYNCGEAGHMSRDCPNARR